MENIRESEICLKKANDTLRLLEAVVDKYNGDFSEIIEENLKCKNILYCKKSNMYLGYFNPCPLEDLIVGNAQRGKISSKKPIGKNYITYYIENKRVRMAEDGIFYYLFFYAYDELYILAVSENKTVGNVLNFTECKYNGGKIIKMTQIIANSMNNNGLLFNLPNMEMLFLTGKNNEQYMFDFSEKEYGYSDNRIVTLKTVKVSTAVKKASVREYKINYNGDYYQSVDFNSTQYKVSVKRKYDEFNKMPENLN